MFCSINCLTDDQVMMKKGLKPCFQECNNHRIHVNETVTQFTTSNEQLQ